MRGEGRAGFPIKLGMTFLFVGNDGVEIDFKGGLAPLLDTPLVVGGGNATG